MTNPPDNRSVVAQERRVLQELCTRGPEFLKAAESLLAGYGWREPTHQVIFNCLSGLSARGPLTLRECLAACATRKGFPDIDWTELFQPQPFSTQEAEVLILRLRDSATGQT
jgi:hypothetical protein